MKNRSSTEISALILHAAEHESSKTRIMFSCLISFRQLEEYLPVLLENGLLHYNSEKQTYRITQKGIWYVELYDEINRLISERFTKSDTEAA